ncbi:MAG TPA: hypothetical protein DCR48_01830 [Flavobacteriales bacterium]|nr:hypothetical protein [Flavobacteriales bacterium]
MKEYLTKSQKVKAACIVRHDNKILLLRNTQVTNPEDQTRGGYFDIPSFTVLFGEDPRTTLLDTLEGYVGEGMGDVTMLDVRQYISENDTTQIFEVLFTVETIDSFKVDERCGKCIFVEESELDLYMFPQEREYLKKYI